MLLTRGTRLGRYTIASLLGLSFPAFVSAVTHELRTPLTTFRLYSEMLASGMVQDETQKKNYLGTLEAEAGRLSHLVENVLAYARIERGSARAQVESVSIGDVLAELEK